MPTPSQIRAARGLLDWSQSDLASRAGVTEATIRNVEKEGATPNSKTLRAIERAFDSENIEFIADRGVELRRSEVERLEGKDGLIRLMNDIYDFAISEGGEICLFNAKPQNWFKWLDIDWFKERAQKLSSFGHKFEMKSIAENGNTYFIGSSYQRYRWFPKKLFISNYESLYAYGDKIAFINFSNDNLEIFIFKNRNFSSGVRTLFNIAWEYVAQIPSCGERGEYLDSKEW